MWGGDSGSRRLPPEGAATAESDTEPGSSQLLRVSGGRSPGPCAPGSCRGPRGQDPPARDPPFPRAAQTHKLEPWLTESVGNRAPLGSVWA